MSLRFTILGPIRVWAGATAVPLDSQRQRAVLATLLLRIGRYVSPDEIAGVLWGTRTPGNASELVRAAAERLSGTLGTHGFDLRATRRGYRLDSGAAHEFDLRATRRGYRLDSGAAHEFDPPATRHGYRLDSGAAHEFDPPATRRDYRLDLGAAHEFDLPAFRCGAARAAEALAAGDGYQAWQGFSAALRLWRGEPAAGLAAGVRERLPVAPLAAERAAALVGLGHAGLALGRYQELTTLLADEAGREPFNEPLNAQLMHAYAELGRNDDALRVFGAIRYRLTSQLGVQLA
ncbi:MAG TPA: BTAD domain-containing putative transcriptional regulator [Candidatus Limnocylindrales bacterium]